MAAPPSPPIIGRVRRSFEVGETVWIFASVSWLGDAYELQANEFVKAIIKSPDGTIRNTVNMAPVNDVLGSSDYPGCYVTFFHISTSYTGITGWWPVTIKLEIGYVQNTLATGFYVMENPST